MRLVRKSEIDSYASYAKGFGKREMFADLGNCLDGVPDGRICVIAGLRRTGKTVMMLQAVMEGGDDAAYVLCDASDTMDDISDIMDALHEEGVRRVLIDEITSVSDFVDRCQFLADLDARRMRIVISGTDSLAMEIACETTFPDRARILRTTRIPFREHRRLLGTTTLDEYARRGGILSDPSLFAGYPLEAIALNIQHSLECYQSGRRFFTLKKLHDDDLLTTAIQKVIHDKNHEFTKDVFDKSWDMSDLTQIRNDIQDPEARALVKSLKIRELAQEVKAALNIVDGLSMSWQQTRQINKYLQMLDLIEPALVIHESDLAWENERERLESQAKIAAALSMDNRRLSPEGKWIFTQPGLRWAQVDALLKSIWRRLAHRDEQVMNHIFRRIMDNAMGSLMEEIIISETAQALGENAVVFKYQPAVGDIDMIILQDGKLDLFEIKHASSRRGGQARHLWNKETGILLERQFGKISSRNVIYSGEKSRDYGCGYINAEDYLLNLAHPARKAAKKQRAKKTGGLNLS